MNIKDKTALVTGASRGIGLSITKALIEKGAVVAGWSRTKPEAFAHKNFHHFSVDLTKELSVQQGFEDTRTKLGRHIPILINNAGAGYKGSFEDMASDDWRNLFDLNVHGIFYTTRLLVPDMKERKEGHIINVSSGAGTNGIAGMACYSATKHAVVGLTESLHLELRDYGIKVSCLSPGSVDTGFSDSKKNKLSPGDLAESVIHILSMPKNHHYTNIQVRSLQPGKTAG
ncbi:SDR family oxidoreductase [Rhodohalobacter mucosus]|uniref:Short-chain dehydrogenase n=1 Tax=Rhodohalobacter mucosus TaxID=2079485 RepID=A0A316TUY7_9BACT|nr:SDR family NAD(P)-dependent oxidoreductase [Rhodohalobacter mucosus]PWN06182.1 short-chain dehydrogenase [Rhodohalobacter mucosus]